LLDPLFGNFFIFFLSNARADAIQSCDGELLAHVDDSRPGVVIFEKKGQEIGSAGIDHDIVGGEFNLENSLLVVYGAPKKLDLTAPQGEYLSVYSILPHPHMIMKKSFGGGIYDVAFGVGGKSIYVASRFGFEITDAKKNLWKYFDPLSEPNFERQRCN